MWCYPKRISGNSVALTESDIKGMLSFTQGFIAVKDVKSWCRKHEMKLLAKEVGVEKTRTGNSTASEDDDLEDDELLAKEELLREPWGDRPQTIRVSVRRHAKGDCPQTIGVSVRRHSQGILSADNRGECPQTLKEGTVRRQSGKVSADTQRGDCPQTIGVCVHRQSKRGLSADNRLGRASADTRRMSIYLYRVHVHVI